MRIHRGKYWSVLEVLDTVKIIMLLVKYYLLCQTHIATISNFINKLVYHWGMVLRRDKDWQRKITFVFINRL